MIEVQVNQYLVNWILKVNVGFLDFTQYIGEFYVKNWLKFLHLYKFLEEFQNSIQRYLSQKI